MRRPCVHLPLKLQEQEAKQRRETVAQGGPSGRSPDKDRLVKVPS